MFVVHFKSESGDENIELFNKHPTEEQLIRGCLVVYQGYDDGWEDYVEDFYLGNQGGCVDGCANFSIYEKDIK